MVDGGRVGLWLLPRCRDEWPCNARRTPTLEHKTAYRFFFQGEIIFIAVAGGALRATPVAFRPDG